ncbi:hypothetical protein BDR05DRAFT_997072 [Suillus weaverae]|nr:hypothetical protein BDR05DRAFT_997072 [Suillus weaverae]
MPPKKSAKVAKLPKKKAKVGAIFSGISRAAAYDIDIDNNKTLGKDPDIITAIPSVLQV